MLGSSLLLASAVGKEKPVLPWLPDGEDGCGGSTL